MRRTQAQYDGRLDALREFNLGVDEPAKPDRRVQLRPERRRLRPRTGHVVRSVRWIPDLLEGREVARLRVERQRRAGRDEHLRRGLGPLAAPWPGSGPPSGGSRAWMVPALGRAWWTGPSFPSGRGSRRQVAEAARLRPYGRQIEPSNVDRPAPLTKLPTA